MRLKHLDEQLNSQCLFCVTHLPSTILVQWFVIFMETSTVTLGYRVPVDKYQGLNYEVSRAKLSCQQTESSLFPNNTS